MKHFKLVTIADTPDIVIMTANQLNEPGRYRKETQAEQTVYVALHDNTRLWLIGEISDAEMLQYQIDDHHREIACLWHNNVETPAERYERYQDEEDKHGV